MRKLDWPANNSNYFSLEVRPAPILSRARVRRLRATRQSIAGVGHAKFGAPEPLSCWPPQPPSASMSTERTLVTLRVPVVVGGGCGAGGDGLVVVVVALVLVRLVVVVVVVVLSAGSERQSKWS